VGSTSGIPPASAEARPRVAAYLVVAGGLFVFLEGLLTGNIVVLLAGFFLFVVAFLIHGEPHHHTANGMLALLLVFLSLVFGLGGFYIGAILAAAGGVMAIVWSPPRPVVQSKLGPQSSPFQTG
jgi:predicted membrane protein